MRLYMTTRYEFSARSVRLTLLLLGALMLVLAALFFTGCASTEQTQVPSWVTARPMADSTYEYFVGFASDRSGDVAKADEQATYSLMSEIVRFLGVRVTATSTAVARSSLDTFQANVVQQVHQTGQARVQGFQVVDRYVQHQNGLTTVYILARYDRKDLLAEQARLAELFHEKVAAIAGPERDGDEFVSVGAIYRAVQQYVEAATAAASSSVDNADVKLKRVIGKAADALSQLALRKLNDNLSTTVKHPFPERFLAQAETSVDGKLKPIADLPLSVTYKALRNDGRIGTDTTVIRTDAHGIARFRHPIPDMVGSDTLTMRVDFSSTLRELDAIPAKDQPLLDGLRTLIASQRLSFSYSVVSRAKSIPLSVVVLDTDIAGNPTGQEETASGVEQTLSRNGFSIPALSFLPSKLKGKTDAEIIAALIKAVTNPQSATSTAAGAGSNPTSVEDRRVAYGIVSIQAFSESNGYIVKVGGTLKVADLASGKILYSRTMSTRSRADNASSAISAAFHSIGVSFGKDIARTLP